MDEGVDEDKKQEYRDIATRRVRLGLVLAEIGQQNKLEVGPDEINREIMKMARNFPGQERQVLEFYQNNPQAMQNLRAPIFEDKVIDFIVEMAKVEEKAVSIEELTRIRTKRTDRSLIGNRLTGNHQDLCLGVNQRHIGHLSFP